MKARYFKAWRATMGGLRQADVAELLDKNLRTIKLYEQDHYADTDLPGNITSLMWLLMTVSAERKCCPYALIGKKRPAKWKNTIPQVVNFKEIFEAE